MRLKYLVGLCAGIVLLVSGCSEGERQGLRSLVDPTYNMDSQEETAKRMADDSGGKPADEGENGAVKANMKAAQMAVEAYATDHGGKYPTFFDDAAKSYFPGGGSDGVKPAPSGLVNPFTKSADFPSPGTITDVASARDGAPVDLEPGKIQYSTISGGEAYAIIGGGKDGKAVCDNPGKMLVISNK